MQNLVINSPADILNLYIKNYVYNTLKLSKKYEQYLFNPDIVLDVIYETTASTYNKHKTLKVIKTINSAQVVNSNILLHDLNKLGLFFSSVPQNIKIYENVNFANTAIIIKDVHHIELRDRQTKKIVAEIQLKPSQRLYNDTKQLNEFLTEKVLPNHNNLRDRQLIVLLSLIARNAVLPVFKRLSPLINRLKRKFSKEAFVYNDLLVVLESELSNTDTNDKQNNNQSQDINKNIDNKQSNNADSSQEQNIEKTNLFKVIESIIRIIIKVPFFIVKGLVYFILALIKLDESYIDKFVDYISLAIKKATIPFLVLINRASVNELIIEARKNDLLTPTEFKNKVNEIKQQASQNDEINNTDENITNRKEQVGKETILEEIQQLIKSLKSSVDNTKKKIKKYIEQNDLDKVKKVLNGSIENRKTILESIIQKTKQLVNQENFNLYTLFETLAIESYIFYNDKSVIFETANEENESVLDNILKQILDILIEDYKNIKEIASSYKIAGLKSLLNSYVKHLQTLLIDFVKRVVNNNEEKYNYYVSYVKSKVTNLNKRRKKK